MPCDYSKYDKGWKTVIRPAILERANNCCEKCGLPNYAVGYRDIDGVFQRTAGNITHDKAGIGELSYKEARALVKHCNEIEDDYKLIIIVLTIAHLDHDTSNNLLSNLRAMCQRCHLLYDFDHHKTNSRNTRNKKKKQLPLF